MNAILLASAGLVILIVGGGVGYWFGRSGVGGSKARAEIAEAELEEYKRGVTEHFGQTAAHFQAIGKEYRQLYEHMSHGAQALCEPDEAGKLLPFASDADAASTDTENSSAETVAETAEEPADEQRDEIADKAASAETDLAGESDSEADTEPKPEAKPAVGEQTLH